MKNLIYTSLSALLLATATGVMPTAVPEAQAQTAYNFTAPVITDSGVLGSSHFFKVAVIGMSLQDIMVSLPSQMQPFNKVKVTDQMGKEVPANVTMNKKNVTISFAKPVPANTTLKVEFTEVRDQTGQEGTLLYMITAQRVGLQGEIPVGTAIVRLPSRS